MKRGELILSQRLPKNHLDHTTIRPHMHTHLFCFLYSTCLSPDDLAIWRANVISICSDCN